MENKFKPRDCSTCQLNRASYSTHCLSCGGVPYEGSPTNWQFDQTLTTPAEYCDDCDRRQFLDLGGCVECAFYENPDTAEPDCVKDLREAIEQPKGSKDTNPKDAVGTHKWRQFMAVPRQALWEVGVGMLEGALKYGRHNYRNTGVRASVYCDAALGHIDQFIEGEDTDPDSGLSHVTKAITSLIVLRDAMLNEHWVDDRPPKIKDLQGIRERLQKLVDENFDKYGEYKPHHYTQLEDGAPYR